LSTRRVPNKFRCLRKCSIGHRRWGWGWGWRGWRWRWRRWRRWSCHFFFGLLVELNFVRRFLNLFFEFENVLLFNFFDELDFVLDLFDEFNFVIDFVSEFKRLFRCSSYRLSLIVLRNNFSNGRKDFLH
jgi:hypothetical protein